MPSAKTHPCTHLRIHGHVHGGLLGVGAACKDGNGFRHSLCFRAAETWTDTGCINTINPKTGAKEQLRIVCFAIVCRIVCAWIVFNILFSCRMNLSPQFVALL